MLQSFLGQVLLAVSPMLATRCWHNFLPPRLDDMACPQLRLLGRAGAFLAGTGVLWEAQPPCAAVTFSLVGQQLPADKLQNSCPGNSEFSSSMAGAH